MTRSAFTPNAWDSIIVRLRIGGQTKGFSQATTRIAELNGHIGAIDLVRPLSQGASIRDIGIYTSEADHGEEIIEALKKVEGVEVIHYSDRTFLLHLGGEIGLTSRKTLKTRDDLSMAYTPLRPLRLVLAESTWKISPHLIVLRLKGDCRRNWISRFSMMTSMERRLWSPLH